MDTNYFSSTQYLQLTQLGWTDQQNTWLHNYLKSVSLDIEKVEYSLAVRNETITWSVGKVIRVDRQECDVLSFAPTGKQLVTEIGLNESERVYWKKQQPAVGDWVITDYIGTQKYVIEWAPRNGCITRRDAHGGVKLQVIASNVNIAAVLQAANNINVRRLERELVVACEAGVEVIVLLTKIDLCDEQTLEDIIEKVSEVAPNQKIIPISIQDGRGMTLLEAELAHAKTLACFGASGVGKSTLVNYLLGESTQRTQEIRMFDQKGRHTTVASQLFLIPGGGNVIDTPGMRSLGLWDAPTGLIHAFNDIYEAAQQCRFSDCTHDHEPGCFVHEFISNERLNSWRNLKNELAQLEDDREASQRLQRGRFRRKRESNSLDDRDVTL